MNKKLSAQQSAVDDQMKLLIQRKDDEIKGHQKTISSLNQKILDMEKKASSIQPVRVPTSSTSSTTPPRLTQSLSKATGAQFRVPPGNLPALTAKPGVAPIPTTRSIMANQVPFLLYISK